MQQKKTDFDTPQMKYSANQIPANVFQVDISLMVCRCVHSFAKNIKYL